MAAKTGKDQDYREMTRDELYELAQKHDIEGRSEMSKEELADALEREDQGPDAIRLLTEQHDEIRRLFGEFDELSSRPSQRKQDLARELVTILVKHAEIEEQAFYPAVATELDQQGLVNESLEEHHAGELLLNEIDGMDPGSDRFDAKVKVLKAIMTQHLEEEEQDLFPRVEKGMPESRRRELGAAMVNLWRVAPTRPHPRTPDTPPGNLVTALPGTVIDVTVGAARTVRRLVTRG